MDADRAPAPCARTLTEHVLRARVMGPSLGRSDVFIRNECLCVDKVFYFILFHLDLFHRELIPWSAYVIDKQYLMK